MIRMIETIGALDSEWPGLSLGFQKALIFIFEQGTETLSVSVLSSVKWDTLLSIIIGHHKKVIVSHKWSIIGIYYYFYYHYY